MAAPANPRDNQLNTLWALFPVRARPKLYDALMNPMNRMYRSYGSQTYFTDSPDTPNGRYWIIALGPGNGPREAPITRARITDVLDGLKLTPENRNGLRNVMIDMLITFLIQMGMDLPNELTELAKEGGGRRSRRSRRSRKNMHKRLRKNTRRL